MDERGDDPVELRIGEIGMDSLARQRLALVAGGTNSEPIAPAASSSSLSLAA